MLSDSGAHSHVPTHDEICRKTEAFFGYRPCLWQTKVAQAILRSNGDVISIAPTGSGKTLTFWIPLLFREDSIQLIITLLNILGKQNVDNLAAAGIRAITMTAETAMYQHFQDIAKGLYRVVVTNIEMIMRNGSGFDNLFKQNTFTSHIISIVWDEGHCVSKWGGFRPEYRDASQLRHLLPKDIPFLITSATLPPIVLDDVKDILQVSNRHTFIKLSNDRPNVSIVVWKLKHALNTWNDLAFLIPDGCGPDYRPPKFLIFFDSIADTVAAATFLRNRLPDNYKDNIKWFNADMSPQFHEEEVDAMRNGLHWGFTCMDSFGMGIDLSDIELIVQWRTTCDLCMLWQRIGCGARDPSWTAITLILVDSSYFDDEKAQKEVRREEGLVKKRKAVDKQDSAAKKVAILPDNMVAGPVARVVESVGITRTLGSGEGSKDQNSESVASTDPIKPNRHDEYKKKPPTDSLRGGRRKARDIEPAMDNFINAGSQSITPSGTGCYCELVMWYFENGAQDTDHLKCRPELAAGCLRCAMPPSLICCELCSPAYFENFALDSALRSTTRAGQGRSRLKDYSSNAQELTLRDALHLFHKQQTSEVFGMAVLKNAGPGIFMNDEVLSRIVDCAHFRKIQSVEQLAKETRWNRINDHRLAVLDLINQHCLKPAPPAPFVLCPLPILLNTASARPATNKRATPAPTLVLVRPQHCSKCGSDSHNARNSICPAKQPGWVPLPAAIPRNHHIRDARGNNTPTSVTLHLCRIASGQEREW